MSGNTSTQFEELAARAEDLAALCAQLARESAELREQVSSLGAHPARHEATGLPSTAPRAEPEPTISRRGVLGKAFGAAAVTVVGTAALVERTTRPAAASNGSNVVAGSATTAEGRTSVVYDGSSGFTGVVLLGNDSTYGGQSVNYPAALGGFAGAGATAGKGGVANGIYGFTDNGNGNAVVGYNSGLVAGSGAGVLALAFSATTFGVKATNTLGTAVSASSDSTSANVTAITGVITSTSPGGFSSAVRGQNNGTGGLGIGVWGSHAGAGWGVYATSAGGIGLNATGGAGTGVSASGATGLTASGTTTGVESSGQTGVVAKGSTTGLSATGPTAVAATGTTVGLNATGPTAISASGTTVGISASGPNAVSAAGTSVGVDATGPTAVAAAGTTTGVNALGPTAINATGTTLGLQVAAPTGISATGTGGGGIAVAATTTSGAPTLRAINDGMGPAVLARAGGSSGIPGTASVIGDSKSGAGVLGVSQAVAGVHGVSKKGRGGVFAGGAAQVQLSPGALPTHPSAGQAGDLYFDSSGRLWLCKRSGTHPLWHQIA